MLFNIICFLVGIMAVFALGLLTDDRLHHGNGFKLVSVLDILFLSLVCLCTFTRADSDLVVLAMQVSLICLHWLVFTGIVPNILKK